MPKGRDDRCDDCGVFGRRIITPTGDEARLCLNCSDDPVIAAVSDIREALDVDPRADTCAFAFGIADALTDAEIAYGRRPAPIAAACVYLGSILAEDKFSQQAVAEAADTSPSALRGSGSSVHYHEFYEASGYADHFGDIEQGEADRTHAAIDLEGWREHLTERQSENTVKASVSNVRRFAVWFDPDTDRDPDEADVEAWLAYLAEEGYAPSTIESRYESLKQYFRWADLGDVDVDVDQYIGQAYQQRM